MNQDERDAFPESTAAEPQEPIAPSPEQTIVIPVIQEQINVHKELRPQGVVRVTKLVHEHEALINEQLVHENVEVERIPVNVIVDAPPSIRTEGDTTIIPIVEEVLIVQKQLRVVEELRITKRRSTSPYQEKTSLRSEEVIVERLDPQTSK